MSVKELKREKTSSGGKREVFREQQQNKAAEKRDKDEREAKETRQQYQVKDRVLKEVSE